MRSLLLLSFVLLFCVGCQPIMRLVTGVKKPRPRSDLEVIHFIQENEMLYDKLYRLQADKYRYFFQDCKLGRMNFARIFDQQGNVIYSSTDDQCAFNALNKLRMLGNNGLAEALQGLPSLDSTLTYLRLVKQNNIPSRENTKYYVMIGNAMFMPSMARKLSYYGEDLRNAVPNAKLLLVNVDIPND